MNRRDFITAGAATLLQATATRSVAGTLSGASEAAPADHRLTIAPCTVDIGPGVSVKTLAYNNQVPGPLLRLREGVPVSIEVINNSRHPDIVHWHGLFSDPLNDGACEEGSPMIPAGQTFRYHLTPRPTGTRWYHTHTAAFDDLAIGTYSGLFGFLLVEGSEPQPDYDLEVNLAIHHWNPFFAPMASMMREQSVTQPLTSGSGVGYQYATINGHMLGAGEPLRVRQGQRVLMRLLNASATDNVMLTLPGHTFHIIAMDGNPVPRPTSVEVLSLAVGERVDAIVTMDSPGVWVLGSTLAKARAMGLGIVVEYAGRSGSPVWRDPAPNTWDYCQFAHSAKPRTPDETIELTFRDAGTIANSRFDTWTINNKSWPDIPPIMVERGKRYRLVFRNGSGDQHPMHIHRHAFEVVQIGSHKLSGLMKDVVNVMPLDSVTVDLVADNPGDSLMHCHMQLHMDYGFMQLIKYKS